MMATRRSGGKRSLLSISRSSFPNPTFLAMVVLLVGRIVESSRSIPNKTRSRSGVQEPLVEEHQPRPMFPHLRCPSSIQHEHVKVVVVARAEHHPARELFPDLDVV